MEENSDEIFPLSKSDDPKAESRISYSQSDIDHHHIDCHLEGQPDAQVWDKKCQTTIKDGPFVDHATTYSLPVGVKQFIKSSDDTQLYHPSWSIKHHTPWERNFCNLITRDLGMHQLMQGFRLPWKLTTQRHPFKIINMTMVLGSKEAERDSKKKWSPTMKMNYRGGIYKGRCKGGFPEGKGRIMYADGLWHHGKKSGLGSFYYINGDVFQGSWRDGLMLVRGEGLFYRTRLVLLSYWR